ncbi:stationary-phase-induced ribosome-associated protein [Providencia vermicola]
MERKNNTMWSTLTMFLIFSISLNLNVVVKESIMVSNNTARRLLGMPYKLSRSKKYACFHHCKRKCNSTTAC